VSSFFLDLRIQPEKLLPAYFFHGEETFLAKRFSHELRDALVPPETQEANIIEKFNLEDTGWGEIIDVARTMPFFFSPWRIIVADASSVSGESFSKTDAGILKDYLLSPSAKTVLIVIYSGKLNKGSSLYRFFSSFPKSTVLVEEMKPPKDKELHAWMDKKLASLGRTATPEAKARLEEIVGNNLQRLYSELEKLAAFAGDKKIIDVDDVNQVSAWVKSYFQWELTDGLEKADVGQCLRVASALFKEGTQPEYVLNLVVNFFRDILLAKYLLREREIEKKEIFKLLRPYISERFSFFQARFRDFFAVVEQLSPSRLHSLMERLEQVDFMIKTTDSAPQVLVEGFLVDYCGLRRREGPTLRERGQSARPGG
jgi:DNA polymerase-3 subunit delta